MIDPAPTSGIFGPVDDAELVEALHAATALGWCGPPRRPSTPAAPRARHGWRRASVRCFVTPRPTDEQLSAILDSAYGSAGDRPVPSAGGLYPLRLLVADFGATPSPARDCPAWMPLGPEESEEFTAAFFDSVRGPCTVVVVAGATEGSSRRYGSRAYRYLLLEAGHCGQELIRAAQAADLGSCPVGAFDDEAVSRLLRLRWAGLLPLYAVAIGRAAGS